MENLILSMPKHGWCNFRLSDEEKEFTAALSYLTDVMYDTLKMCLTYLQTGAAAVMYDREGEGTFLFVMSEYHVYVLDENLPSGMVHFENLRADDICENILNCYYADTIDWLNFANMNEQNEKEYKKYEQGEAAEVREMVKEIRKLLNERTGRKSKWTEIRCDLRLSDEEKKLTAALSYLTDVMYDTLKMCLTYLQSGAAAVMYDREGEGTFLFVMSDYDIYILDENLPDGMVHFEDMRTDDICEDILGCYYADTIGWLNFANMNEHSKKEYEKYEKKKAAEVREMVKEIRKLLNERTGRKSKWTEIRCDFFDEEEKYWLVDAWKTGNDNEEGEVIAKISESGEVGYLDAEAEDDEYAKEVIGEKLKDLA